MHVAELYSNVINIKHHILKLTAVCQFSLFVCAALIDFRKRCSFV